MFCASRSSTSGWSRRSCVRWRPMPDCTGSSTTSRTRARRFWCQASMRRRYGPWTAAASGARRCRRPAEVAEPAVGDGAADGALAHAVARARGGQWPSPPTPRLAAAPVPSGRMSSCSGCSRCGHVATRHLEQHLVGAGLAHEDAAEHARAGGVEHEPLVDLGHRVVEGDGLGAVGDAKPSPKLATSTPINLSLVERSEPVNARRRRARRSAATRAIS